VQVVPAAQSWDLPPLHAILQATEPPHASVQPALPPHSAVQPPAGQSTVQVLLPVQESVEPFPSVMSQVLPPPHVTLLSVPALSVHVLVPSQVEVQPEPQLPTHVDRPSHVVVQPVPHVESQVPFESQLNVTSLGSAAAASAPAPPSPAVTPPNEHLPPAAHVQMVPVQVQSPVQLPPEASAVAASAAGMGGDASLPHPVALTTPARNTSTPAEASSSRRLLFDMNACAKREVGACIGSESPGNECADVGGRRPGLRLLLTRLQRRS